jgi:hypothetical protein
MARRPKPRDAPVWRTSLTGAFRPVALQISAGRFSKCRELVFETGVFPSGSPDRVAHGLPGYAHSRSIGYQML